MNVNVSDRTMPTMNRSSSSGVHSLVGFIFIFFARIYQPLSAVAHSDASRLLAEFVFPIRWVLAIVAVAIFAANKHQRRQ
jgi:hypothetical protein